MSEKHTNTIKKDNKNTNDVNILVDKKIELFKDIIQRTILHVQKNKTLDILGVSDISACIDRLNEISKKITEITGEHTDSQISGLQFINNELSCLFKNYGTENLEDLLIVCFGNNHKITIDEEEQQKFDLLKKYFHPSSYKLAVKKVSDD